MHRIGSVLAFLWLLTCSRAAQTGGATPKTPKQAAVSLEAIVDEVGGQQQPATAKPSRSVKNKRLGIPRATPISHPVAGSQSSSFPATKNKDDAIPLETQRHSDPTTGMNTSMQYQIDLLQRQIDLMKMQAAGVGTPPQSQAGVSDQYTQRYRAPPKGFTGSFGGMTPKGPSASMSMAQPPPLGSSTFMGQQPPSLAGSGTARPPPVDPLNRPGVSVSQDIEYDENGQAILVTKVVQETPRGLKTSRFCSLAPPSSAATARVDRTASTKGSLPQVTSRNAGGPLSAKTARSRPGGASAISTQTPPPKPAYKTANGYPLYVTDEMPFPHVLQPRIAPWSKAAKEPDIRIDMESESSDDGPVDPASDPVTPGKGSSILPAPLTVRRFLRKSGSHKPGKGFLANTMASDGGSKRPEEPKVVEKGSASGSASASGEDDPPEITLTPPKDPSQPKKKVDIEGELDPPKKKKSPKGAKDPNEIAPKEKDPEQPGQDDDLNKKVKRPKDTPPNSDLTDTQEPTTRRRHKGSQQPSPDITDSATATGTGTRKKNAQIIEEDEPSDDSFEENHICKRLIPLMRYLEYEVTINMTTTSANLFALLMSLFDKLGAFN